MAVSIPPEEGEVNRAYLAGLADSIESADQCVAKYRFVVYTLSLKQLGAGATIQDAVPVSWLVLTVCPNGEVLACDVCPTQEPASRGKPPVDGLRLTSIARGAYVQKALEVIANLETHPEVAEDTYEPRMLTIPGLMAEILWLKAQAGPKDLVVILRTVIDELRDKSVYTMAEFLDVARQIAKHKQESRVLD